MGKIIPPEQIKRKPEEFGGMQFQELSDEDCETRLCAARWCGNVGFGQLVWRGSFRVLCRVHLLRTYIATAYTLGDPSPLADARVFADEIRMDWGALLREIPYAEPTKPEEFRCILCGGMMMAETVGMLSGRRWIHTCGEEKKHSVFGLCGNRGDHMPHEVTEGSLAPFWCTAKQELREPYASEKRAQDATTE